MLHDIEPNTNPVSRTDPDLEQRVAQLERQMRDLHKVARREIEKMAIAKYGFQLPNALDSVPEYDIATARLIEQRTIELESHREDETKVSDEDVRSAWESANIIGRGKAWETLNPATRSFYARMIAADRSSQKGGIPAEPLVVTDAMVDAAVSAFILKGGYLYHAKNAAIRAALDAALEVQVANLATAEGGERHE